MALEQSLSLSEVLKSVSIPLNLLTNILQKIRKTDTEAAVLQACVDIIYQTLKCDRAVVYSLQPESRSKVVAEAVTPGYTQTLDTVIEDPCFEAGYIDKYQKGRIRAITDIHDAGMNPCYLETLDKLDVKANFIAPLIATDGSLYGLLIMHQCSQTRQWKQSETVFMLQIADWAMETINRRKIQEKLQAQLDNAGEWQEILTQTTRDIHSRQNPAEVLQTAVERAKEILKCDRVVVYALQDIDLGKIVAEATIPALASIGNSVIKDPCFEYYFRDKYQSGRVRAIDNIFEAGMTDCYVENLDKIGVKSNLVVPINDDEGKIYGLLVAHECFEFREWQPEEIEWLKQVGIQTGLAVSKAQLKEQLAIINSNHTDIEAVRDAVTIAKAKVKQVQQPIKDTSSSIVEINQLNKLLHRELDSIDQTGSSQAVKETKLIKIMIKKLSSHTEKIKDYIDVLQNKSDQIEELIEDAAITLYSGDRDAHAQSDRN